jgi:hypothetical protein
VSVDPSAVGVHPNPPNPGVLETATWLSKHRRGSDVPWQEDIFLARAMFDAGLLAGSVPQSTQSGENSVLPASTAEIDSLPAAAPVDRTGDPT